MSCGLPAFDDEGELVPSIDFDFDEVDRNLRGQFVSPEAPVDSAVSQSRTPELIAWLVAAGDAEAIGRKVLLVAYLSRDGIMNAPRSQRELADRMRLSPARVNGLLHVARGEIRSLGEHSSDC